MMPRRTNFCGWDYPKTFAQKCNLVLELYAITVVDGELKTAYEPLRSHKVFLANNKEKIIERIEATC